LPLKADQTIIDDELRSHKERAIFPGRKSAFYEWLFNDEN
jgi:hypothetical protein